MDEDDFFKYVKFFKGSLWIWSCQFRALYGRRHDNKPRHGKTNRPYNCTESVQRPVILQPELGPTTWFRTTAHCWAHLNSAAAAGKIFCDQFLCFFVVFPPTIISFRSLLKKTNKNFVFYIIKYETFIWFFNYTYHKNENYIHTHREYKNCTSDEGSSFTVV